jgi:hypothetical protein
MEVIVRQTAPARGIPDDRDSAPRHRHDQRCGVRQPLSAAGGVRPDRRCPAAPPLAATAGWLASLPQVGAVAAPWADVGLRAAGQAGTAEVWPPPVGRVPSPY